MTKIKNKKLLWLGYFTLALIFAVCTFKFGYNLHSQYHTVYCTPPETSADASYTIYNPDTDRTLDMTFPASFAWPGNATHPRHALTSVVGVDIDYETLQPYCLRREEWVAQQRSRGKMFSGWDKRHMTLSIQLVPRPGTPIPPRLGRYIIPTGEDKYGYPTYEIDRTAEDKHKYGYDVLHVVPAGVLADQATHVKCNIVAPSRTNIPKWAGKPNICSFQMKYMGAFIKVKFQVEQMQNLPEVKRKAIAFMDTYTVNTIGEKLWHFLTMWKRSIPN